MKPAELAIRNQVTSWVLVIAMTIAGLISLNTMGRLEDPEFTIRIAIVTTMYPGASAKEVEQEITDPLENAIQQMQQVDEITSKSRNGRSEITVGIKDSFSKKELTQIWDELRKKLRDASGALPPGAGSPMVNDDFGDTYGSFYALTGDGYSPAELKGYAKDLRKELVLVDEVAKVSLYAVQQETIYIEMSRGRLREIGITPDQIYKSLTDEGLMVDAGTVKVGNERIRVSPKDNFDSVKAIQNIRIKTQSDRLIRLGDVSDVIRGYKDRPAAIMRFNGEPAIGIGVSTIAGGNVVNMGAALDIKLREIEELRPLGMEMHDVSIQAKGVEESVAGFLINLLEAIIIVIVILMLFMGLRSGLIIGATLFLIVMVTIMIMDIWGIQLQRISLGALIVALGMLVDNAIVVCDGVLVRMKKGMTPLEASNEVISQTIWPLFGATIIGILAFAALGLSEGGAGEYTSTLFQVVLVSLLLSWVLAITITPLFCHYFLKVKPDDPNKKQSKFISSYMKFVGLSIRLKAVTAAVLVGMFLTSLWAFQFVNPAFFPNDKRPQFTVDIFEQEGTDIHTTAADFKILEEEVMKMEGVKSVSSFIGQGALRFMLTYKPELPSPAYGQLLIEVDDASQIAGVSVLIEDFIETRMGTVDYKTNIFKLGPPSAGVEVRLSGPDPQKLRELSEQVMGVYKANNNTKDSKTDWGSKVKLLSPVLIESQSRQTGINRKDVAKAIRRAYDGENAGLLREGDELIPIVFRAPERERNNPAGLKTIDVWSSVNNAYVPIESITSGIESMWENELIARKNRARTITISCEPKVGDPAVLFTEIAPVIEAIALPPGYSLEWGGQAESSKEANEGIAKLLPLVVVLMFLILVILFNGLRQPIIIFASVGLSIIGVTSGLLITDTGFEFMAILGVLSLSGMIIKNSVVLIDEFEILQKDGRKPYDAILEASGSRLRPVILAAATTILGMIPLFWDVFFRALGVTIAFGLGFATVLTLVAIPTMYAIVFRISGPKREAKVAVEGLSEDASSSENE